MLVCLSCFHVFAGRAEVAARAAEAEAKKARLKAKEAADKERWAKEAAERERLAEIARYERRTAALEDLADAKRKSARPKRWTQEDAIARAVLARPDPNAVDHWDRRGY